MPTAADVASPSEQEANRIAMVLVFMVSLTEENAYWLMINVNVLIYSCERHQSDRIISGMIGSDFCF